MSGDRIYETERQVWDGKKKRHASKNKEKEGRTCLVGCRVGCPVGRIIGCFDGCVDGMRVGCLVNTKQLRARGEGRTEEDRE